MINTLAIAMLAAVWLSANDVEQINEVVLRRARLVLRWVSVPTNDTHFAVNILRRLG